MILENREKISDLEIESINNFYIKEIFLTLEEEIDYFFESKINQIPFFIEGIDYKKLSQKTLQNRFYNTLYCPKQFDSFFKKLEKRVRRELTRLPVPIVDFHLQCDLESMLNLDHSFCFIEESARTLKLASSTEKVVDLIWKKSTYGAIPKGVKMFTSKLNVGDYLLSNIGLSSKETQIQISDKIRKITKSVLKQHRSELIYQLKLIILTQILNAENLSKVKNSGKELKGESITKTA